MKNIATAAAILGIVIAGPALAQTTSSTTSAGQQNAQAAAPATSSQNTSQQNMATVQKIKQDLQSAGFQDVNVVAESFVVQAKTKDGNPVLMTIGPHGMSVFEALNVGKTGSNATASANTNSNTTKQ
jgi:hypothetical protein